MFKRGAHRPRAEASILSFPRTQRMLGCKQCHFRLKWQKDAAIQCLKLAVCALYGCTLAKVRSTSVKAR